MGTPTAMHIVYELQHALLAGRRWAVPLASLHLADVAPKHLGTDPVAVHHPAVARRHLHGRVLLCKQYPQNGMSLGFSQLCQGAPAKLDFWACIAATSQGEAGPCQAAWLKGGSVLSKHVWTQGV
jgi:hypothetical protein